MKSWRREWVDAIEAALEWKCVLCILLPLQLDRCLFEKEAKMRQYLSVDGYFFSLNFSSTSNPTIYSVFNRSNHLI